MNFSLIKTSLSLLVLISCNSGEKKDSQVMPNIIVIMADDLGYQGIGCFGNKEINTPNLDYLASNGIRFTDFHSNAPVCTPTRASFLTGKYPQRTGLEGVILVKGETRDVGLDSSEDTIADVLKTKGYTTGVMGKWHLGYKNEYNPIHNGFDEFYGYRSGNIDYHSHYDNAGIYDWYHNLDTIHEEGYVTDLITSHSVEFIKKNKDEPFFLFVSHEAPHVPFQSRDDSAYRFPDKEFTYFGPVEDRRATYIEMVEAMDEGIGEMFQALEKNELLEKTIIFFFSDNGALDEYGDNGELRGSKFNLFEGGHRVPAIAYWKGRIKPSISDDLILSYDLFPSFLSIISSDNYHKVDMDGIDISTHLLNQAPVEKRNVFWRYRDQKVIRYGKYKLLIDKNDTLLFDLKKDLYEEKNYMKENTDLAKQLAQKITKWEEDMAQYNLYIK